MAADALFSEDGIDMCHSEVTIQTYLLNSEIVFREPSATGDLGVTSHKRQTTNFRERPVRIKALSPMSNRKSQGEGKITVVMCQMHEWN